MPDPFNPAGGDFLPEISLPLLKMPEFKLPKRGYSLGDYQLKLDPLFDIRMQQLLNSPLAGPAKHFIFYPNWYSFTQPQINNILNLPLPPEPKKSTGKKAPKWRAPPPPWAQPTPFSFGLVMDAVWKLPKVRLATDYVLERLKRDYRSLSTGGKVALITHGVVIAGTAAAVLQDSQIRSWAYRQVLGKKIPVPGVSGLSLKLLERGGAINWSNIGNSGVGVSGETQVPESGPVQLKIFLQFDATKLIDRLQKQR